MWRATWKDCVQFPLGIFRFIWFPDERWWNFWDSHVVCFTLLVRGLIYVSLLSHLLQKINFFFRISNLLTNFQLLYINLFEMLTFFTKILLVAWNKLQVYFKLHCTILFFSYGFFNHQVTNLEHPLYSGIFNSFTWTFYKISTFFTKILLVSNKNSIMSLLFVPIFFFLIAFNHLSLLLTWPVLTATVGIFFVSALSNLGSCLEPVVNFPLPFTSWKWMKPVFNVYVTRTPWTSSPTSAPASKWEWMRCQNVCGCFQQRQESHAERQAHLSDCWYLAYNVCSAAWPLISHQVQGWYMQTHTE